MSDSSSHSFSHIQNGQRNRIPIIESVKTKLVIAVSNVSQENGYIRGYRFHQNTSNKPQTSPKYKNQKPAINKTIRISKPSKRVYISINQLLRLRRREQDKISLITGKSHCPDHAGRGHFVFMKGLPTPSTSKGVWDHFTAHQFNVGGEVLCHIYQRPNSLPLRCLHLHRSEGPPGSACVVMCIGRKSDQHTRALLRI